MAQEVKPVRDTETSPARVCSEIQRIYRLRGRALKNLPPERHKSLRSLGRIRLKLPRRFIGLNESVSGGQATPERPNRGKTPYSAHNRDRVASVPCTPCKS